MDTVFIKGLKAASVIGCYDWERDIRQTLVIDLELKTDFARAAETDALSDALDYAAISKRVVAVCDESRFQLLEALAERLAAILLAEFAIMKLRMTITKPGAVPEAEGVGVVITREKPLAG
jgi:dihydroneopterin aldolase